MREPSGGAHWMYLQMLSAYKAAFGVAPIIHDNVADERYFIVGCGKNHRHEVHRYHDLTGAPIVEYLAANHCYTIDVDATEHPHRVGSFWNYDHTEDIPSNHFERVVFENLPRTMFENPGWCLVGLKTAFRIIGHQHWVVVRTSEMEVGRVAGDNVREALGIAGFVNITEIYHGNNNLVSIWAQKP